MQFIENSFFAAKLVGSMEGKSCWEIIRKVSLTPGVRGELLEVVAQCFQGKSDLFLICDIDDYDLSTDFSEIGVFRAGYLSEVEKGDLKIDSLGESWQANFVKLDELGSTTSYKKSVYKTDRLRHSLNVGSDYFFESFFKRDRIYWGLTEHTYPILSKLGGSSNSENNSKTLNVWEDVVMARNSAENFSMQNLSVNEINEVLGNSLFNRDDGSKCYGSAGGFDVISAYAVIRNSSDLSPGIYKIDAVNKTLDYIRSFEDFELINNFLFLNTELENASVYFFFALKFDEIIRKYGQRSLRFSLITLGGAIQQLHLASTAMGLSFRAIGGFDELQMSKILELPPSVFLTSAAILGK